MRRVKAFPGTNMTMEAMVSRSTKRRGPFLVSGLSKRLRVCDHFVFPILFILSVEVSRAAEPKWPVYFDLGPQLVEEFQGSYEFKYKRVEFDRTDPATYLVKSSGDESPSEDKLTVSEDYVYWILSNSGEKWIALKTSLRRGDQWQHKLRGWNQHYRVTAADIAVSVPAGRFEHCVVVTISWDAHEHDMEGPQKIILYLAPHLGIIKQEHWHDSAKEHEEVLTKITKGSPHT